MTPTPPGPSVTVGGARVTFLPDGRGASEPTALFVGSTPAAWERHRNHLDDAGRVVTRLGGFLVEVGERCVVVDTGLGPDEVTFPGFGTYAGGGFLDALAAAGVAPAEVSDVVFTHLHADHVGWSTRPDGQGGFTPTFANARHWVAGSEWDHWAGRADPAGPHPDRVQAPLAGRVERTEDGTRLTPEIRLLATPGHTPGHQCVVVEGGDDVRVVLLGDVLHSPVQLAEPSWEILFDVDRAGARRTRDRLLPQLEHPGTLLAAGHFAGDVFGRLARTTEGLSWRPYGTGAPRS